jgi:hypothetical protein
MPERTRSEAAVDSFTLTCMEIIGDRAPSEVLTIGDFGRLITALAAISENYVHDLVQINAAIQKTTAEMLALAAFVRGDDGA